MKNMIKMEIKETIKVVTVMGLVIHVMVNKDHLLNYVIDIYFVRYE